MRGNPEWEQKPRESSQFSVRALARTLGEIATQELRSIRDRARERMGRSKVEAQPANTE